MVIENAFTFEGLVNKNDQITLEKDRLEKHALL